MTWKPTNVASRKTNAIDQRSSECIEGLQSAKLRDGITGTKLGKWGTGELGNWRERLRPERPFDVAQGRPELVEGRGAESPSESAWGWAPSALSKEAQER